MLYDRILTLCELEAGDGSRRLRKKRDLYFGEATVGITRFYTAMQAGTRVDMTAELWPAGVQAGQYCLIDGDQYRVIQVQRKNNSDGLPVELLSLRLSETVFPVEVQQ